MMIEDSLINGLTEKDTYLVLAIPECSLHTDFIIHFFIFLKDKPVKIHDVKGWRFILMPYTLWFHKVPISWRTAGNNGLRPYHKKRPLTLEVIDVIYNPKGDWNYDWWKPTPTINKWNN